MRGGKRWLWRFLLALPVLLLTLYIGPDKILKAFRMALRLLEYQYYVRGIRVLQQIRRQTLAVDPVGRYYLALGYLHKEQVIDTMLRMLSDGDTANCVLELGKKTIPLLTDFAEGDGTGTLITKDIVLDVEYLLEKFRHEAPDELIALADSELERFPLHDFIGLSPREAWELARKRGHSLPEGYPVQRDPADIAMVSPSPVKRLLELPDPRTFPRITVGEEVKVEFPQARYPFDRPAIAVGSDGTVHVAWAEKNGIGYAVLLPGQKEFSPSERAVDIPCLSPDLGVDKHGLVHLVCLDEGAHILHAVRDEHGWNTPEVLAFEEGGSSPRLLLVDDALWVSSGKELALLDAGTPPRFFRVEGLKDIRPAADGEGNIHVAGVGDDGKIGYTVFSKGEFSPVEFITGSGALMPDIAVSAQGEVHLAWVYHPPGEIGLDVRYVVGRSGEWGQPQRLSHDNLSVSPVIALDDSSRAYVAWTSFSLGAVVYTRPEANPPELFYLVKGPVEAGFPNVAIGPDGSIHTVWRQDSIYLPAPEFLEYLGIFYRKIHP